MFINYITLINLQFLVQAFQTFFNNEYLSLYSNYMRLVIYLTINVNLHTFNYATFSFQ